MLDELLTKNDCKQCKKCCIFFEDELVDAPLFSYSEKEHILKEIDPNVKFQKKWEFWQIILLATHDNKYACPLLNHKTWCILWELRPFDCKTWPFYIMRFNGQYVITLSRYCQKVNDISVNKIRRFIDKWLVKYMLEIAKKYPDLVSDYHDWATILEVIP